MDPKEDYLNALASKTAELNSRELAGPSSLFTITLQQMAKDSGRWVENKWVTPTGDTAAVDRVIQILSQDLIVLLNHGAHEGIQDDLLETLLQLAGKASEDGVMEDPTQQTLFKQLLDTEA